MRSLCSFSVSTTISTMCMVSSSSTRGTNATAEVSVQELVATTNEQQLLADQAPEHGSVQERKCNDESKYTEAVNDARRKKKGKGGKEEQEVIEGKGEEKKVNIVLEDEWKVDEPEANQFAPEEAENCEEAV